MALQHKDKRRFNAVLSTVTVRFNAPTYKDLTMKILTFNLLTLNLLLFAVKLSAQTDTLIINSQYQFSYEKPIKAGRGIIKNFADTVYIVNPGRLNFYENLRTILNKDLSCKNIISAYEISLKENTETINNLIKLSDAEKKLNAEAIKNLTGRLIFLENTLNKNETLLNNAQKQIIELEKNIKKKNRKTYLNYGIIAVSGILTGILITKIK